MGLKIALVGNPNSGKTTIFNQLTNSYEYVGNWAGVTVDVKSKIYKNNPDWLICDLPGIYSLTKGVAEEIESYHFLTNNKMDLIINVLDATCLERNLFLTLQLIELDVPVLIILNMLDEAQKHGIAIHVEQLSAMLGVPVLPMIYGGEISGLIETAVEGRQLPKKTALADLYSPETRHVIQTVANHFHLPLSQAVGLLLKTHGKKTPEERTFFEQHGLNEVDWVSVITKERYQKAESIYAAAVAQDETGQKTVSQRIDDIVTHRFWAFPIFFGLMLTVFWISFHAVGPVLSDGVDWLIAEVVSNWIENGLLAIGASPLIQELVVDGIVAGVGSILVFLPQVLVLFFFLSLLEDSGYMARVAFVTDSLFTKIGLSGKAFIPMLTGFGCSVPAIMAARTIADPKEKRLAILITPFMSCSARLPIYALFASAFFPHHQMWAVASMYGLGIVVAVLSALLLKNSLFKSEHRPIILEMIPYRMPTWKGLSTHLIERVTDFLKKAATVIFAASVAIWFLQRFNFSFQMVEDTGASILGDIGRFISPIFVPLGFGDWKMSVALLTGLIAKEAVVSTLSVLNQAGEAQEVLLNALSSQFSPASALSFMTFCLLYLPCIASFATMRKEMNSEKYTWFAVAYQLGIAYVVAFLVYQGGRLIWP